MKWISSKSGEVPDHGQVVIIRSGSTFQLAEYNAEDDKYVLYANTEKALTLGERFHWAAVTPPN